MLRSSSGLKRDTFLSFGGRGSDSPPPLPGFDSSAKRKRKSFFGFGPLRRFLPNDLEKFLSFHSRAVKSLLAIFLFLLLIYWLFNTVLILFRFKISDGLLSSGWIGVGLKIRKPPLIFVQSSQSAAIVWESNKMASSSGHQIGLRYWTIGTGYKNQTISLSSRTERRLKFSTGKLPSIKRTRPEGDNGWRRWVHTALIEDLEPGCTYGYEIVLLNKHSRSNQFNQLEGIKKVYSKHRFTWYGIDPIDLTRENHVLSNISPTSKSPMDVLHIVVIGDNQFGVKVFKNLARRFMDIKSYIPKLKSSLGPRQIIHHFYPTPIKPSLIFHLGDAVQGVDNLKQWQTDFWDPLTFKNKLTSEVPIVHTKGNHDFDPSAHNLYSGGIPKVQVGEMNRTQIAKLNVNSPLELPGIAEADKSFTTFTAHERDPRSRGTYFAYSPHPRVRVIVCDSNLEPSKMIFPGSTISEVDEHERWLLWEMARPEWKEASIRIILIHIPPFVEFWDKHMWTRGHESDWGQYVRNRFAPHFHALSSTTMRYDIPRASMVISGHSHMYSRGMLSNFVASEYFTSRQSSEIPIEIKKMAKSHNKQVYDPHNPHQDEGVVYVISGGAGGPLDHERVEDWGFYERSIIKRYHFNYLQLDMSQTLLSMDEWTEDWNDSKSKRISYKDKKLRVYNLVGSQLVCKGTDDSRKSQLWEAGHYPATDRLIWTTRAIDGQVLDRFIIEAGSCR